MMAARRVAWSFFQVRTSTYQHGQLLFQFMEFNQSGVFIMKSWLHTSKMLKIETIAKTFKTFHGQ